MAVYQGARLRDGAPPARRIAAPARSVPTERARPRVRPIGLIIAAILVSTMLGLVYLTQTLGSNATSSQIGDMTGKSNELRALLRTQASAVEGSMNATAIEKRARKLELTRLGDAVVLPAP